MQNFYEGFGAPADFKTILEQISSDDIMFVYEGVGMLRTALTTSDEKSLTKFPYEAVSKKLVQIIQAPSLMDISNEIKLLAMLCLYSIMDIFPQHVGYLISIDVIGAIKTTMDESMGYIDLVEQCIKSCERISQEFPREILKKGMLQMAFNMIDFFDVATQKKILALLMNVSDCSEEEEDFTENLLPVIPNVCQMLQNSMQSDSDRVEKLSIVLSRISVSFMNFVEAWNFEKIGDYYDQLSVAGVHETVLDILRQYSNYVQALTPSHKQQSNQINTDSKHQFSEATISNVLKVLQYSCNYSHQVVMQLISAGIFEMLEPLLPLEVEEDHTQLVTDLLSLIQSILPSNEPQQDLFTFIEEETNELVEAVESEEVNEVSTHQKVQEARRKHESEKKSFLQAQDASLHNHLAKSLLPKIFVAYSSQINNAFRTKCLTLISRMLQVIPQPLLAVSFDPASFTKFIHMILRQQQPQQVLCCLETVQQLLMTDYGTQLSVFFKRHGIRETILEFTQPEMIELMNQADHSVNQREMGTKELLLHMHKDRERIAEQHNNLKLAVESQNTGSDAKKEQLQRMYKKSEDLLKQIDKKTIELVAIDAKQLNLTEKNLGQKVAELATMIQDKHIEDVVDDEIGFYQKAKTLAAKISTLGSCDVAVTQQVMTELATILTQGLTSFEFSQSGLLQAFQSLLTETPSQDLIEAHAIQFITRLKVFVDAMCHKEGQQLPFRQLFQLCHEQLTLLEPLIFKEPTQEQISQQQQITRGIIVNLVFDIDGTKSNNVLEETKEGVEPSKIFQRRQQLYDLLKEFPIPVKLDDSVGMLEDFLLKRVRTHQDINGMLTHATRHFGMIARMHQHGDDGSEAILKTELQPLADQFLDRMSQFIDESVEQEYFNQEKEKVRGEMLVYIQEWEKSNVPVTESFYKYVTLQTQQLIEQMAREDYEEMEQEEIQEDERELILQEIAIKTDSFVQLINSVKTQAFKLDKFKKLDRTTQVTQLPESLFESIEVGELETVSSHPHPLTKHPDGHHTHWGCDRVQGSLVCRSKNVKGIQGWRCDECDFDICIQCIKVNRFLDLQNKIDFPKKIDEKQLQPIEELLKEHPDVEIEFFYDKKKLDVSTPFIQISKDKPSEMQSKSQISQIMLGSAADLRTIHFMIKEREPTATNILDLLPPIQVEKKTIQTQNCVTVVQSLLHEFSIIQQAKDEKSPQYQTLIHTLRLLKAMYFIYQNLGMFITSGLSLLCQHQIESDDIQLQHLSTEMSLQCFHHQKLDNNFAKIISDPNRVTASVLNPCLKLIYQECPFLFSFETKNLYLKVVSFKSVDPTRALFFIQQNAKKAKKQLNVQLGKIERQKVAIDRNKSIVEQTLNNIQNFKKRAILEITYVDEEGTGLGPTLEFYNLLGKELASDETLWRENIADGMLFPRAIEKMTEDNAQQIKLISEKFALAGAMVARSLIDDRLINLSISPVMWDLVFGKKFNIFTLKKLDQNMFNLFADLQLLANRKHEIDIMDIDQSAKDILYQEVKTKQDTSVEDYDLTFYDPSNEKIVLIPDGGNVSVTLENLQEYIDLVLDSMFNESVRVQIDAFRKGFSTVMPVDVLTSFDSQNEIEDLVCGATALNQNSEEWTDINRLQDLINTAHGFTQNSKAFLWLLQYITEVKPEERSTFIQFLTGSPRLPIGGFGKLDPKLTVVLKKPLSYQKETANDILPSVMTCQNYVKMPEYTSYQALKLKFDFAIREGSVGFTLS